MLEIQEDLLGEEPIVIADDGQLIGLNVKPVGGSWGVYATAGKRVYGLPGDLLAMRPDKQTAIHAALQLASQEPNTQENH